MEYDLISMIGKSIYGPVYLAKSKSKDDRKIYAVKSFAASYLKEESSKKNILKAQSILKLVRSDHVINLINSFSDDLGSFFEVSEYCEVKRFIIYFTLMNHSGKKNNMLENFIKLRY
jgi:serine/threonine protein kinase